MINTLAYEISQVHIEREVHRDSPIKSLYYAGICGMCNHRQFWEYTDSITAFDPSFRKIALILQIKHCRQHRTVLKSFFFRFHDLSVEHGSYCPWYLQWKRDNHSFNTLLKWQRQCIYTYIHYTYMFWAPYCSFTKLWLEQTKDISMPCPAGNNIHYRLPKWSCTRNTRWPQEIYEYFNHARCKFSTYKEYA